MTPTPTLIQPAPQGKTKASAHKLLAQVSHEMALDLFEGLAKDNLWFQLFAAQHPNVKRSALPGFFARKHWHLLVPQARAILATMLASPDLPEAQKATIAEALVLDNSLPQGQNAASVPASQGVH